MAALHYFTNLFWRVYGTAFFNYVHGNKQASGNKHKDIPIGN